MGILIKKKCIEIYYDYYAFLTVRFDLDSSFQKFVKVFVLIKHGRRVTFLKIREREREGNI